MNKTKAMNSEENNYAECNSLSALDITVDNVVQVLLSHEEEIQNLHDRKQSLDIEIEKEHAVMLQVQNEKAELEGEITRLKLRNATYRREHANLRNAITVVRYQVEKIKECIESTRTRDLENLNDFEKSVDDITEKFRAGPDDYAQSRLLEKIKEEKDKKNELMAEIEKLTNAHMEFVKQRGLRPGRDEGEEIFDYIMPGSELFTLIEITKNLEQIGLEIEEFMMKTKSKNEK